jgi:hypothetical protein
MGLPISFADFLEGILALLALSAFGLAQLPRRRLHFVPIEFPGQLQGRFSGVTG